MDSTLRTGVADTVFRNLGLTGLLTESFQDNITAKAGGGQSGAVQLISEVNRITTVATAGDSVVLPEAVPGLTVIVINHGANALQVFGLGDDTINDVTATTGVSQMVGSVVLYCCTTYDAWYTEGLSSGYSGGLQTFSFADALSANSGGVQSGATAITTLIARFTTVGGAGYSAVLPAAAGGLEITVINAAAANSMKVFPAGTDAINSLAASAAFSLPAGAVVTFYCTVAGKWHTIYYNPNAAAQAYATATNTTGFTATAAQLTGGLTETVLNLTGTLGAGATVTTDTATNIIAAIPNAQVGNTYRLRIINSSSGAFSWTVAAGAGVTANGTLTIAQNTYRDFIVSVTNIGTPAVTMQSLGQVAVTAI